MTQDTVARKVADLRRATNRFMARHWDETALKSAAPAWILLNPEDVPDDAKKGGCYAIFDLQGRLTYVGVALSEFDPNHPKRKPGLIRRLYRHVIRRGALSRGLIEAKREAWNENGGIARILILPFPPKYSYLAAALEIYLIRELGSGLVMNKSRVRRVQAAAA